MQFEVYYRDQEYDGWTADVVVAVDAKAAFYARWPSWHPWNDYARSQVRLVASEANTGSIQNVRN